MPPGPLRRSLGLGDLDEETRAKAVAAEGPSWREWFYFEFLKVWIALALLIVDSWIVAGWSDPLNPVGLAATLAPAIYLEFLLYRYLWYRPNPERADEREFRRTIVRPVRFGRWTPEAWRAREGRDAFEGALVGPDPREFL